MGSKKLFDSAPKIIADYGGTNIIFVHCTPINYMMKASKGIIFEMEIFLRFMIDFYYGRLFEERALDYLSIIVVSLLVRI